MSEKMWERLRGQFAIALWDERRRQLQLGRDRFGIAPLFWTRQGDWLLFSHPKLKDCSPRAWSRCGPIVGESIMFSLFRPCLARERVLKASNFSRLAIS